MTRNRNRTVRYAGARESIEADETEHLVEIVRRELGSKSVSSARRACSDGKCGACRLLVNGEVVNACMMQWSEVPEGATIEAYETLADDAAARHAVEAFSNERPTRCRLCVGALAVTAVALARKGKAGDADAIEDTLASATCMCTGRGSLRRALLAR